MTGSNSTTDLLIVGAGPAGLAHAFWRCRANSKLKVTVVEQQPKAGGWVQTHHVEGYTCEIGPQGIRPSDASEALVNALEIQDQVIPASSLAKQRFLARNGKLHPLPNSPISLLTTSIFSLAGKISLCLEPFRKSQELPDETLAQFVARRFGKQAVPLAEALANGVFGGDAHALEMAAAFPEIKAIETKHGSLIRGMLAQRKTKQAQPKKPVLHSFAGGMHTMIQALCEFLGDRLRLSTSVSGVTRQGNQWIATLDNGSTITTQELVLAVPARVAGALLEPTSLDLAQELKTIPYASVSNIYLGYPRSQAPESLNGFGYLIDRRDTSTMLGAIYCSSVFPTCAPDDHILVRVMAGGTMWPGVNKESDEVLIQQADAMLRSYTGLATPRVFEYVQRAPAAIPQYVHGHRSRVARIRSQATALPNLQLLGNSFDAVSIVGQLKDPVSS